MKLSLRKDQIQCLLTVAEAADSMIGYECKPSTSNFVKALAGTLAVDRLGEIIPILKTALGLPEPQSEPQ